MSKPLTEPLGRFNGSILQCAGVPTDIVLLANNLYGVTLNDELICLDLKTGQLKWFFEQAIQAINLSLTSHRWLKLIGFFGGLDGKVYAFDSKSGKRLWEKDLGARISSSLVVSGGSVYAGSANKRIHQLNAKNGEVISDFAPGGGHILGLCLNSGFGHYSCG